MLSCLIIEDEPLARQTLVSYAEEHGGIQVQAACRDADSGLRALKRQPVDCLFLDINLPRVSGLTLLRNLDAPPLVVLTTAYPQYAVEGFELDVVDYLVKPFGLDRFSIAVDRVAARLKGQGDLPTQDHADFLWIRADSRTYRVEVADIQYCQGKGDYVKIRLADRSLITHHTLKGLASQLPTDEFVRVHKSYLVNLQHLSYLEGNQVGIGAEKIPIGAAYKEAFLRRIGT